MFLSCSLTFQMCLKCADLSALTFSPQVHRQWAARLGEEFFRLGDRERALGLPISPLMDRSKSGIPQSQPGFFSVVAIPMFTAFSNVFPGARPLLEGAKDNYAMWVHEVGGGQL